MEKTLLSPTGSPQALFAAVSGGADAVYLGINVFNARMNADNFTLENVGEYIKYAHLFGVKVFATLNILVKDAELSGFFDVAKKIYQAGADAFILQDLAFGKIFKRYLPGIELHLSTQAGVNNVFGALAAKECGFSRVVLARETALTDIKKISEIIETEVFVQGALCSSFSGQCLFSSFVGGNSGNRGFCKQPCRQKYSLNGAPFNYAISPADLCVGGKIYDLINAGATAFKIEGRMRRPEYVYAATKFYRDILDGRKPNISALKRAYNRGNYTAGLAFGQNKNFLSTKIQSHIGEKIGFVKTVQGGKLLIETREKLSAGSAMKLIRSGEETGNAVYLGGKPNTLEYKGDVKPDDEVYITTDASAVLPDKKLFPVEIEARVNADERLSAATEIKGEKFVFEGEKVEKARNAPLTEKLIEEIFKKTDKFPFAPKVKVKTQGAFVPVSVLNKFRRDFYAEIYDRLTDTGNREIGELVLPNNGRKLTCNRKITVIDDKFDFDLSKIDIAVFSPEDYNDEKSFVDFFERTKNSKEKYLYLPAYLSSRDVETIEKAVGGFDGIYSENSGAEELGKKWAKSVFWGTGANIFNSVDLSQKNGYVCLSNELTKKESENLNGEGVFVHAYGGVPIMNFVYCPFGRKCNGCKTKEWSTLTDESGRMFPLRRYRVSECRFQLFNCAKLVGMPQGNILVNALTLTDKQKETVINNLGDSEKIKDFFVNYTAGHTFKPVT